MKKFYTTYTEDDSLHLGQWQHPLTGKELYIYENDTLLVKLNSHEIVDMMIALQNISNDSLDSFKSDNPTYEFKENETAKKLYNFYME